jgi:Raf kinase inhibitor-like YbhB/YbcL family protein
LRKCLSFAHWSLVFSSALLFAGLVSHGDAAAKNGAPPMTLHLSSSAIPNGGDIPRRFTCDGDDISPALSWNDPPAKTAAFALIVDDPDAPSGTWTHWILYDLPGSARKLPEDVAKDPQLSGGGHQGRNSFRRIGYGGPCPPRGPAHRYFFRIYALDSATNLPPGASRDQLEHAMDGHVLASGELMGRYARAGSH